MSYVMYYMDGKRFNFVDLGCFNGFILAVALTYGADKVIGVDIKADVATVWPGFWEFADKHRSAEQPLPGLERSRAIAKYNQPAGDCELVWKELGNNNDIALYMFVEGWAGQDMQDSLQAIARKPEVKLLMCSCPKRSGHPFKEPERLLSFLNVHLDSSPPYQLAGRFPNLRLSGSGGNVPIYAFVRTSAKVSVSTFLIDEI